MMAQHSMQPQNPSLPSPICAIPTEILDGILDYVGADAKALRQVNHKFDACSRSAFYDVVGGTVFDIRSPASMRALQELSESGELTSSIKQLKFRCVYARYHDEDDGCNTEEEYKNSTKRWSLKKVLTPGAYERWLSMRDDNVACYGKAFDMEPVADQLCSLNSDSGLSQDFDREEVIGFLEDCLSRFSNLQSVEFLSTVEWAKEPGRYQFLYDELNQVRSDVINTKYPGGSSSWKIPRGCHMRHYSEVDWHTTYAASMLGFDMLIRAMTRAGISPKELAFPVPGLSFQGFSTFTPTSHLLQVLKKTESLHLYVQSKECLCRMLDQRGNDRLLFTASNFPSLRHLRLDHRDHGCRIETWSHGPSEEETLQLHHFTLCYTGETYDEDEYLEGTPDFINHFGPHLKIFTRMNTSTGSWNKFLIQLGKFNLDRFEFIMEPQAWAGHTAFHKMRGITVPTELPNFREETLYSAARTILIEPPQLKQIVMQHMGNGDDRSDEEGDDW